MFFLKMFPILWYINTEIIFHSQLKISLIWQEIKTTTGSKCNFTVKSWNKYLDHKFSVTVLLDYSRAIIYKFEECINTIHR